MKMVRTIIIIAIVLLTISLVGCQSSPEEDALSYEIVTIGDIDNDDVIKWYDTYYSESGTHQVVTEDLSDYTFLLISAGEKPTGGYSIVLKSNLLEGEKYLFTAELTAPKPDQVVTEALTYPNLLIKVKNKEDQLIVGQLITDDTGIVEEEDFIFENVLGLYIGQIDNNFIEVQIDENSSFVSDADIPNNPMSFMVDETVQSDLLSVEDGSNIEFDCYLNENGTYVIVSIKN